MEGHVLFVCDAEAFASTHAAFVELTKQCGFSVSHMCKTALASEASALEAQIESKNVHVVLCLNTTSAGTTNSNSNSNNNSKQTIATCAYISQSDVTIVTQANFTRQSAIQKSKNPSLRCTLSCLLSLPAGPTTAHILPAVETCIASGADFASPSHAQLLLQHLLAHQQAEQPTPTHAPAADLFEGAIVGVACGDTIGALVEGKAPDIANAFVESLLVSLGNFRSPTFQTDRKPGSVTDDTENTRALVISLLQSPPAHCRAGYFDVSGFATHLHHLFLEQRIMGMGGTSRTALKALQPNAQSTTTRKRKLNADDGENPSKTDNATVPTDDSLWIFGGTSRPAPTNGSCMRSSPIGLVVTQPEYIARGCALQSQVTHVMAPCKAASAAVAAAIQSLIALRTAQNTHPVDTLQLPQPSLVEVVRNHVLEAVKGPTELLDPTINYPLTLTAMLATSNANDALAQMKKMVSVPREMEVSSTHTWPISSYSAHTALWALYSFLCWPFDFWRCVLECVRIGGDTDTTAAIAGAISGAFNGFSRIRVPCPFATKPKTQEQRWPNIVGNFLCDLRDDPPISPTPPVWNVLQLRNLARALHRHMHPGVDHSLSSPTTPVSKAKQMVLNSAPHVKVLVVGISGSSSSGKSTVSHHLHSWLVETQPQSAAGKPRKVQTALVCQDGFFAVDDIRLRPDGSWESDNFLDHNTFAQDIALEVIASTKATEPTLHVILVEGFRIFSEACGVREVCDHTIWVDVREENARERRRQRPFHKIATSDEMFDNVVWPNIWGTHEAYQRAVRAVRPEKLEVLDGNAAKADFLVAAEQLMQKIIVQACEN